jgi:hypothetical protein
MALWNYFAVQIQKSFRGYYSRKYRKDLAKRKRYLQGVEAIGNEMRARTKEFARQQEEVINTITSTVATFSGIIIYVLGACPRGREPGAKGDPKAHGQPSPPREHEAHQGGVQPAAGVYAGMSISKSYVPFLHTTIFFSHFLLPGAGSHHLRGACGGPFAARH